MGRQQFERPQQHQPVEAFQQPGELAGGEEIGPGDLRFWGGAESRQGLVKLRVAVCATDHGLQPELPGIEVHVGLEVADPEMDQRVWSGDDHTIAAGSVGLANGGLREPHREVVISVGHIGDADRHAEPKLVEHPLAPDPIHQLDQSLGPRPEPFCGRVGDEAEEGPACQSAGLGRPGEHPGDRRGHAVEDLVHLLKIHRGGYRLKGVELGEEHAGRPAVRTPRLHLPPQLPAVDQSGERIASAATSADDRCAVDQRLQDQVDPASPGEPQARVHRMGCTGIVEDTHRKERHRPFRSQFQIAGEEATIFRLQELQKGLAGPGIRAGEKPDAAQIERPADNAHPIELDPHRPKAALRGLERADRPAQEFGHLPADVRNGLVCGMLFKHHARRPVCCREGRRRTGVEQDRHPRKNRRRGGDAAGDVLRGDQHHHQWRSAGGGPLRLDNPTDFRDFDRVGGERRDQVGPEPRAGGPDDDMGKRKFHPEIPPAQRLEKA